MMHPTFCGKDRGDNVRPLAVEVEDGRPVRILGNPAAPPEPAGCRRAET